MEPNPTQDDFTSSAETAYKPTSNERTLAILSHVLTLIGSFIAPLVIYLIKKDESPYVAMHAKESLNFQLTATLVTIALMITLVGILLIWLLGIAVFVLVIIATVKANDNKPYRYPLTIRFIK